MGSTHLHISDRLRRGMAYPAHCHEECELVFVENAFGVRRIVGDSVEMAGEYDLVLVCSSELGHAWVKDIPECCDSRVLSIRFQKEIIDNFGDDDKFAPIKLLMEDARRGVAFPVSAIMSVYHMLDTIYKEQENFYSFTKFLAILHELSKCRGYRILSSSPSMKANTFGGNRKVQAVQEFIEENYKSEIRLSTLAEIAGISDVALSRLFKAKVGKSLSDYIIDVRLGYAEELLCETDIPVSEVSSECGFNNLSNFNRIFKKYRFCSPMELRERRIGVKKIV